MDIEEIIEKIGDGGLRETARRLGLPAATVRSWRARDKVPEWRHDHIRSVAKRLGVKIAEGSEAKKAA